MTTKRVSAALSALIAGLAGAGALAQGAPADAAARDAAETARSAAERAQGSDAHAAGAQAEDARNVPAAEAATATPLFDEQDLRFLQHMIVHHEQALVMSALVPERTERESFVRFARYVDRAQASEIAQMKALLELAAARGQQIPEAHFRADPPMAGMLSSVQMDALAAANGEDFERLWIEGMIFHHQGAIDMAQAQQRRQLDSGRRPYGLSVLVEDIIVEQRAEITKMRQWLREWGLAGGARDGPATAP